MTDLMLGQWALLPQEELHKRLVEEEEKLFFPHLPPQEELRDRPALPLLGRRPFPALRRISALRKKIRLYFHPPSFFSRLRKTP
jgi:hypothetical protein